MSKKPNLPIRNKLALAVTLACASPMAQAGFIVDGIIDGNDSYSLGFDVAFNLDDGSVVEGGKLFLGSDATGHFLHFAMPLDFVDNSYGTGAVGWSASSGKKKKSSGHTFDNLLGSDSLGKADKFILNPINSGGNPVELQVDYIARVTEVTDQGSKVKKKKATNILNYVSAGITPNGETLPGSGEYFDKSEGKVEAGDASGVLEIATSLEYNVAQYASASDIANGTGVIENSPDVDPDYTNVALGFENWVFEVAYEFRFDAAMFDACWTDLALAYDPIAKSTNFFKLGEAHVSPHKTPGKFVNAEFTPIPPPTLTLTGSASVPEPGSLVMLGLGLAGLGWGRLRKSINLLC